MEDIKYPKTKIPSPIRYHPNTLKSCFLIYPIKNRITITDTANATAIPTARIIHSLPLNEKPDFASFRMLAPNMTGMARKKVNSAAAVLDIPSKSAPTIVAPERDVPGKTAAANCQMPIMNAIR